MRSAVLLAWDPERELSTQDVGSKDLFRHVIEIIHRHLALWGKALASGRSPSLLGFSFVFLFSEPGKT